MVRKKTGISSILRCCTSDLSIQDYGYPITCVGPLLMLLVTCAAEGYTSVFNSGFSNCCSEAWFLKLQILDIDNSFHFCLLSLSSIIKKTNSILYSLFRVKENKWYNWASVIWPQNYSLWLPLDNAQITLIPVKEEIDCVVWHLDRWFQVAYPTSYHYKQWQQIRLKWHKRCDWISGYRERRGQTLQY